MGETASAFSVRRMLNEYLRTQPLRHLLFDAATRAAIVAAIAYVAAWAAFGDAAVSAIEGFAPILVPVSGAAFATILTLLVKLATTGDRDFIRFLKATGALNAITLHYLFYLAVSAVGFVLPIVLAFVRGMPGDGALTWITATFVVFFTTWAVGGLVLCIRTVHRYLRLRAEFLDAVGDSD